VASPIPLHGGIKGHALCEENAHLQHMQRLIRALQRVRISLLSRACLNPPLQGDPADDSQPAAKVRCLRSQCSMMGLIISRTSELSLRCGVS
jgi:hypothetical protein